MLFTTSWDDGHPHDFRVADLLAKYGMTGTFYVCRDGQVGAKLTDDQIRSLARRHEVGAHTLSHPSLRTVSPAVQREEIGGSKKWLESIVGAECPMFAYPYGHHNETAVSAVREAGFRGARTAQDLLWNTDPFHLSPTIQVHHFPFRPILNRRFVQPIHTHWNHLRAMHVPLVALRNWSTMTTSVFRYAVATRQPWFHLWGHSWSLECFGLWDQFEEMLQYIHAQPHMTYVTNSQLLRQ